MAKLKIQWAKSKLTRAKPVPAAVWDEHKDELDELYREMTLDDLMVFMSSERSFSPNKRQYIFQFEKWGFRKYEKPGVSEPQKVQQERIDLAPETTVSSPIAESRSTHTTSFVSPKSDSSKATKRTSDWLPLPNKIKKHMTTFDATNHESQTHNSPADLDLELAQGLSNFVEAAAAARPPRPHQPVKLPTKSIVDAVIKDAILDFQEVRRPELKVPAGLEENASTMDEKRQLPLEQRVSMIHLDGYDDTEVVSGLQQDRVEDFLNAADVLVASGCPVAAFVLYVVLLKRHLQRRDLSTFVVSAALSGCTRSAMLQSHVEIAENMIKKYIGDRSPTDEYHVQLTFYLRYLNQVRKPCLGLSVNQAWDDLEISHAASKAFLQSKTPEERRLRLEVMASTPQIRFAGYSYNEFDRLGCAIHTCLAWCGIILEQADFFEWGLLSQLNWHDCPQSTIFLCLYYGFFRAYTSNRADAERFEWALQAKTEMALSPALFLSNVTNMILKELLSSVIRPPLDTFVEIARGRLDMTYAHVITCCHRLCAIRNPSSLSQKLFDIHRMGWVRSDLTKTEDPQRQAEFFLLVKQQIERDLSIRLPTLPALYGLESSDSSGGLSREEEEFWRWPVDSRVTLASSPRSSDYGSFTALRQRIRAGSRKKPASPHGWYSRSNSSSHRMSGFSTEIDSIGSSFSGMCLD